MVIRKKIIVLFLVLLSTQCSSIISYDEYSKKGYVTFNNKEYQILINLSNTNKGTVKYKKEIFADREVVINIKSDGKLLYNKVIQKNAFLKFYDSGEINNVLIYSCHLNTSSDISSLFRLEFNICEPETDNCKSFNMDFEENGEYTISEEVMSNEGEE